MLSHRQTGMSLIESMVALVVISIGLLGIAALQITAMTQNTSALNHGRAVWMGHDMADRIRANLDAFDNYTIDTTNNYSEDCINKSCTAQEMVQADAKDWKARLETLPSGRGLIVKGTDGLKISVMWDDEGTGATAIGCSGAATDLACYQLEVYK